MKAAIALLALLVAACDPGDPNREDSLSFPDVMNVEVSAREDGQFRFDVTVSSPYDSPEQYADAWRVTGLDGAVFGVRELLHDHTEEQPFTRSLDSVAIPAGVSIVVVQGRDLVNGWGGSVFEVLLPGR